MMLATDENCFGLGAANFAAVGMISRTWADNNDTYLRKREPAPRSSASATKQTRLQNGDKYSKTSL